MAEETEETEAAAAAAAALEDKEYELIVAFPSKDNCIRHATNASISFPRPILAAKLCNTLHFAVDVPTPSSK